MLGRSSLGLGDGDRLDRVKHPLLLLILWRYRLQRLLVVYRVSLPVLVGIPHLASRNELLQGLYLSSRADKAMLQEVSRRRPALIVFGQALSHKVFEVSAEVALQFWWRILWDMEQDFHRVDVT